MAREVIFNTLIPLIVLIIKGWGVGRGQDPLYKEVVVGAGVKRFFFLVMLTK